MNLYKATWSSVIKFCNIVMLGEESGGVFRRRARDQTEVSTITLMSADVGVCSYSLHHNRFES